MKLFLKLKGFITAAGIPGMLLLFHPVLIVFVTRGRVLSDASAVDTSSAIQIVFLAVCAFVIFRELVLFKQVLLKKMLINSPFKYLLFFNAFCFLSAFWSPNAYLTIYRSFECLVFLLLITITIKKLIQKFNYPSVIKWTIWFAFWNLSVGILFILKLAGLGSVLSIPFSPSRLFFPLFFFIILILGNKLLPKIITGVIVLIGFSNKIFIGVALGFLSFFSGSKANKLLIVFVFIFVGFFIMYIGIEEVLLNTLFYGRDSVGLGDSSGRNTVWLYMLSKAYEQPFVGYGFVAGEIDVIKHYAAGGIINSHNSFISAFVNVGAFGLLFLILFFINLFRLVLGLRVQDRSTKAAFLGSIILIIVVSMSAPGIGSRVYGAWIPSVYIIALIVGLKAYFHQIPKIDKKK